jgi:hypothetical protein
MKNELIVDDNLKQLRELLSYPCADMRLYAEERIIQEYGRSYLNPVPRRKKVQRNWDIHKGDIELLNRGSIVTCPLEDIFYGINNLFCPTDMLDVMNKGEIFAVYLGTGITKRNNRHLQGDLPREHFSDLIKYLNNAAFQNPIFRKTFNDYKKQFTKEKGYALEQTRLSELDPKVKERFFRSFFSGYRPSNREEPDNPESFYDPMSRSIYVNRIYNHFIRRFEKEHESS